MFTLSEGPRIELVAASNSLHTCANIATGLHNIHEALVDDGFLLLHEYTSVLPALLWGLNDFAFGYEDERDYALWITKELRMSPTQSLTPMEAQMLPNFIHIGAAKCASTWLWRVCQEHPNVCVPTEKVENFSGRMTLPDHVNFFVADFDRGLNWYEQTYFSGWNGEPAVGEFSNSYMVCEHAHQRIADSLPGVKLTMTLRNPAERAFVHFAHHVRHGHEERPFEEILDLHRWQTFRMFIELGFYHLHLTRLQRRFSPDQLKVMIYDDLVAAPREFVDDFLGFIGVETGLDLPTIDSVIGFPRPDDPDTPDGMLERGIAPEMRARLDAIFADDISRLEDLLDRDLGAWRAR